MENPLTHQQELNVAKMPDPLSSRPVRSDEQTKTITTNQTKEVPEALLPFVHFY